MDRAVRWVLALVAAFLVRMLPALEGHQVSGAQLHAVAMLTWVRSLMAWLWGGVSQEAEWLELIFISRIAYNQHILEIYINMKTLQELGSAVAARREGLGLKQRDVALQAGVTPESLSRFERGRLSEFGSRKLLAVLAVLGMQLQFTQTGQSGSLDELRRERGTA